MMEMARRARRWIGAEISILIRMDPACLELNSLY